MYTVTHVPQIVIGATKTISFIAFYCILAYGFSLHLTRSGAKSVNREVPVFGHYEGIFFLGKIDELRMETEAAAGGGASKRTLTLEEFKTRSQLRLPGKAQKDTHDLQVELLSNEPFLDIHPSPRSLKCSFIGGSTSCQVMLYKHFVDEIVSADDDEAAFRADRVCESLGLDKNLAFGCELIRHFRDGSGENVTCLKELFAKLARVGKGVPKVTRLVIDYAFQVRLLQQRLRSRCINSF